MTVIETRTMDAVQEMNRKMPEVELRDLFAMNTLAAFGGGSWNGAYLNILDKEGGGIFIEKAARVAYRVADAMMKAREVNDGSSKV